MVRRKKIRGKKTKEELIEVRIGGRELYELKWYPYIYNEIHKSDIEEFEDKVEYTYENVN